MKSIFIFLFVFVSTNSIIMSQNKGFVVGTFVGFYGVHINGETGSFYSSNNGIFWGTGGYSLGLNVKHDISKKAFLAFELRYSKKGSIYEYVSIYGTQAYEYIRLDYLELPFLIGVKLNLKNKYLIAETGFSYARLFSSKMEVDEFNNWNTDDKLNGFKQNDVSWIANLKYPIVKSKKLLLGFRFSYSLVSIHSNYKLYNMDYGVELYYLFNRKVD